LRFLHNSCGIYVFMQCRENLIKYIYVNILYIIYHVKVYIINLTFQLSIPLLWILTLFLISYIVLYYRIGYRDLTTNSSIFWIGKVD